MIRPCWLILLVIPLLHSYAQSNQPLRIPEKPPIANQFEHLSVEDGLSNDFITAILQDRDGFMWFGTGEGLNKYDGSSFTVFKPDPSRPARSFQNGYIMGLCEGDSTQLWAVTRGGGLHEINRKTGVVIPHSIQASQANRWNNQHSIFIDHQRILWISAYAGLARYDPARHHFTLYPSPVAEVPVITAFEDRQKRFWVATHQGLYLFDRPTGKFTPVAVQGLKGPQPSFQSFYLDENDVLWLGTALAGYSLFKLDLRSQPWNLVPYNPRGELHSFVWRNTIHRDSTGMIWIGTTKGLQGINPASDQVFTYESDPNRYKGLASSSIQALYHDRSGMIWIGTNNGIDRQAVNTKPFSTYQVKANERRAHVPENRAYAVFKDAHGQLWFNNSPGIYRLSADQQRLDPIPPEKLGAVGDHYNEVRSFLPDGKDGIWLGSYDGLYHFDQASGQFTGYPSEMPAQFIAVQQKAGKPQGDVWIGGDGGFASFNVRTHRYTYYRYQPGKPGGIPDRFVYGLLVSQSGAVWILIHRLGLCRLNPETGQITRYSAGPKGHLSSNDVRTIYEDPNGIIWIGTYLGGLNRFDPKTGLFSTITHQDGIPGHTIVGITGDASGHLWLSTNDGLCRIDPRTKAIRSYQVSDGLPSSNFKQNAVFRSGNQLIFGSENGIVQFDPDQIRDDTRPFPVYVTGLTVMDKPRQITGNVIHLQHDENFLSIAFAALAYEQPRQNQYAYQLVGINPDWVQNGNRTVVNFTSLPPGQYTFRVKAANSNGFWSPHEAAIQVIVHPPWWASWWAYGLYGLAIAGAIWGYIRFSTNRFRQRQELELNRRQAEQFKAIDELKTRFFSNITHEFRTPLSLIIAPVEKLLQEGRFDGPMLRLIHQNAEKLLRLINQLLDIAKLEGNYMTVSPLQGQVTDFIHPIVAVFQRAAEQKGITLTYTMDHFPAQAQLFDADKWEKILTNLLANALKFTGTGGSISLTVAPVWVADEMTGVHFQLVDSGIGMAPQHIPHIFDRFYQADTSTTRAHEGTGLGLALVHELIQLLGGHIAVESEVGVGTRFNWMLPVSPVTNVDHPRVRVSGAPLSVADPPTPLDHLSGTSPSPEENIAPRILIVEDNQELREFLVGELTASYQVLQAVDGQQGWEVTQAELPDIVLTDVMMPRLDGHELSRLIKGHADTDHIAVVMLTAKAAQPSRLQGLQEGADDYLTKPFSMAELRLRLQNLFNRQQRLRERYQQQFLASATAPSVEGEVTHPLLERIYDLMDERLDDPQLSVEWLADQLAISRRTLHRKVVSLTPWVPNELIRQYRIRKAAGLLQAGHTVSETADLVGFSTPSHFAMVFKEVYQQTPTEFMTSPTKSL
ncbi:hybrid sensor histidine kinase/response regulator transcription factor [Larkinella humicola]|uniref:histidine kinase n=1 Tax=Larkinella humicola TaxID=2607654 RepID=A0A5N1J631_9BACT|nr:two-component regulator propeller domain-containing protein [Larkinella humicola]KAA9345412.1 response regulator [Larkinella humicola]